MITIDDVRAAALRLPATSERAARGTGHPQFVTNGKCFAEVAGSEVRLWSHGDWSVVSLARASRPAIEAKLLAAWRLRATRRAVAGLDYAQGAEDLQDVFGELRTWPDLVARGEGDFHVGGRAFLHFHHFEDRRHADVKEGLGWGDPIPFPLGVPSKKVTSAFYAEVRRRLGVTLEAIEAAKAAKRRR